MLLVQRDYVVEQVSSATPDLALSHSILPRAFNRRAHRCDLERANRAEHFETVLRVVIEQQELGDRIVREGLSELLGNPTARGMPTYIEVQDAPTVVANNEKAVQHFESERRYREEAIAAIASR
jgi:hypothetical protein